jgi:predicted RNase H-like HicB family nuclease
MLGKADRTDILTNNEMKTLQHTIKAVIRAGEESGYVAECMEIPVVTQGATLDEVSRNLQEAVALHLEEEDLATMGLAENPMLLVTMELEPAHA